MEDPHMLLSRRAFAASAAAAPFVARQAFAETEIKLGHVGEPGSLIGMQADELAKRATAKLAGKAKATVSGSSQLGSDSEMMKKLKLGASDLAEPSTVVSSYAP